MISVKGAGFGRFGGWLSPISRRFRMPQHLPHRLARNAKPTCRLSLAQTINMAGQPNAQIQGPRCTSSRLPSQKRSKATGGRVLLRPQLGNPAASVD